MEFHLFGGFADEKWLRGMGWRGLGYRGYFFFGGFGFVGFYYLTILLLHYLECLDRCPMCCLFITKISKHNKVDAKP